MDQRTAQMVIIVVGVTVVWFALELLIRRGRTGWRWLYLDGAIVAAVLFITLRSVNHVSIRPLAWVFGILLMALCLLVIIGAIRSLGWVVSFRRKVLASLGTTRIEAPEAIVSDPVKQAVERFEALGFERVTTTISEGGDAVVHLIRPSDGVVAEAVADPHGGGAIFDYTSILDGGRGALVTTMTGLGMQVWDGYLVQAFPGATARHLLENHEDGLAFLRERGIEPDPVTADELLAVRARLVGHATEAARSIHPKLLRADAVRIMQRQHGGVGPLRDRPNIDERLERFRAVPSTGGEPVG